MSKLAYTKHCWVHGGKCLKVCIAYTKLGSCKILNELESINNYLAQLLDLLDEWRGAR